MAWKLAFSTLGVPGEPLQEVIALAQRTGCDGLELRVRDDGRGFDTSGRGGGLGLDGMAERARLVGGELTIDSQLGRGTELVMRMP